MIGGEWEQQEEEEEDEWKFLLLWLRGDDSWCEEEQHEGDVVEELLW